jgi:hypothetical protein
MERFFVVNGSGFCAGFQLQYWTLIFTQLVKASTEHSQAYKSPDSNKISKMRRSENDCIGTSIST